VGSAAWRAANGIENMNKKQTTTKWFEEKLVFGHQLSEATNESAMTSKSIELGVNQWFHTIVNPTSTWAFAQQFGYRIPNDPPPMPRIVKCVSLEGTR